MDEQDRRRPSESKSDSETTPDNRKRLQRSLESSVECIDADIGPCGSNNDSNGNVSWSLVFDRIINNTDILKFVYR